MLPATRAAAAASGNQNGSDLLEVVLGDGGQAGAEVLVGSSLVDKHGFGVGDGAAGNAAVIEAGDHTEHLVAGILYSAGSDANTIYGDSYNFTLPGNTMGFAINTGRMAGESVADYIADLEG